MKLKGMLARSRNEIQAKQIALGILASRNTILKYPECIVSEYETR